MPVDYRQHIKQCCMPQGSVRYPNDELCCRYLSFKHGGIKLTTMPVVVLQAA
jgi:hypothetical protein